MICFENLSPIVYWIKTEEPAPKAIDKCINTFKQCQVDKELASRDRAFRSVYSLDLIMKFPLILMKQSSDNIYCASPALADL